MESIRNSCDVFCSFVLGSHPLVILSFENTHSRQNTFIERDKAQIHTNTNTNTNTHIPRYTFIERDKAHLDIFNDTDCATKTGSRQKDDEVLRSGGEKIIMFASNCTICPHP